MRKFLVKKNGSRRRFLHRSGAAGLLTESASRTRAPFAARAPFTSPNSPPKTALHNGQQSSRFQWKKCQYEALLGGIWQLDQHHVALRRGQPVFRGVCAGLWCARAGRSHRRLYLRIEPRNNPYWHWLWQWKSKDEKFRELCRRTNGIWDSDARYKVLSDFFRLRWFALKNHTDFDWLWKGHLTTGRHFNLHWSISFIKNWCVVTFVVQSNFEVTKARRKVDWAFPHSTKQRLSLFLAFWLRMVTLTLQTEGLSLFLAFWLRMVTLTPQTEGLSLFLAFWLRMVTLTLQTEGLSLFLAFWLRMVTLTPQTEGLSLFLAFWLRMVTLTLQTEGLSLFLAFWLRMVTLTPQTEGLSLFLAFWLRMVTLTLQTEGLSLFLAFWLRMVTLTPQTEGLSLFLAFS